MYVYDDRPQEENPQTWRNVEVTFYARRVEEYAYKSSQGLVIGARSEHQAATQDPCMAQTYYGKILYDGRVNFQKELWHQGPKQVYTEPRSSAPTARWNPPNPEVPRGEWIGVKFVIRNVESDTQVRLELYRDRTGGMGSGHWEPLSHLVDTGDWTTKSDCRHPAGQLFLNAATSVFIRNDFLVVAEYARFSIREIAPG